MFVPSLSWENDRFNNINGSKMPFFAGEPRAFTEAKTYSLPDGREISVEEDSPFPYRAPVRKKAHLFWSAFPMFVPSLSWQNDGF
jgi:hypothetical protein